MERKSAKEAIILELSRRDLVLKLIVEEFVSTAEPVGSNTLIEKYQLPYSSATIRNEMAMLEQDGLIEKLHQVEYLVQKGIDIMFLTSIEIKRSILIKNLKKNFKLF